MRKIRIFYDFIRLWIKWGDRKEAWQDANYLNDPIFNRELKGMDKDIDPSSLSEFQDFNMENNSYMQDKEIIKLQKELIEILESQVVDLSVMSKIELGNDVIDEIRRLKILINEQSR